MGKVFPYVQKYEFEGLLFSDASAFQVIAWTRGMSRHSRKSAENSANFSSRLFDISLSGRGFQWSFEQRFKYVLCNMPNYRHRYSVSC